MTENFTVYVVDDDPGVLRAMCRLLNSRGYQANPYGSPRLFLEEHDAAVPGCAILDVSMPDLDGLELQRELATTTGSHRPLVFVTGKADIPTSVRAMKAGAIDFLTKPVKDEHLFDAISRAQEKDAQLRKAHSELESIRGKVATLTPREREVLALVVAGRMNKQIGGDLGTAERTIKIHRSRVMEKMGTRTLADLVRMAEKLNHLS